MSSQNEHSFYVEGRPSFADADQAFVVTFPDQVGPDDAAVYSAARIEQSRGWSGPWHEIESVELLGESPWSLTTTLGVFDDGVFRLVWIDDEGGETATEPVAHHYSAFYGCRPSIGQLALHLRHRLTDNTGQVDTFNDSTNPTLEAANGYLDEATQLFLNDVGIKVPGKFHGIARSLVALRAAQTAEGASRPAQIDTSQSNEKTLSAQYLDGVRNLKDQIRGEHGSATGGRARYSTIQVTGRRYAPFSQYENDELWRPV